MNMQISRRLNNTYQRVYRNRHLIAKNLKLNDREYRLWDLYIAIYDWDKGHIETYQTVQATDLMLSEVLGWSPSKVCRVRNLLLEKGSIKSTARSTYSIVLLPQKENNIAELKDDTAKMQDDIAPVQEKVAEVQQIQSYPTPNTTVSYKDKYRISTEEEYVRVKIRVDQLNKQIDVMHCWLSDKPEEKVLVDEQQRLAGEMLIYEIDNDLLPI